MSLFESVFSNEKPVDLKQKKKLVVPSTAGAIPVKNAKGTISMETVKVKRYVAGKMPEYAEETNIENIPKGQQALSSISAIQQPHIIHNQRRTDHGRRQIFEPQIIKRFDQTPEQDISVVDELSAEDRRKMLRDQLLKRQAVSEEPIHKIEEFEGCSDVEHMESSEYTSDSESETIPRLKPVFVPKHGRITVQPDEEELSHMMQIKKAEIEEKRRLETKQIVAQLISEEILTENKVEGEENIVVTDDDDEETAFEQWKVRELKRINRELEETEAYEAEKQEVQRLRLMTEEERQAHLAANPKIITNQPVKGEYKFLQKYYHRGVFYLDAEEEVLKQNFAEPTLEDRFDKSVLPSVLQVKNFGKAGRTKYTHLVDQDTSCFIGPWSKKNEIAGQFSSKIGGGMKQTFERPGTKRKHT